MAILKDLIVHGSSRFLNKIYANELQTPLIKAEAGIFKKLKADDATVVGLLDVKGQLHTNSWSNSNIATIDGSFYITPTIGSDSGTVSITSSSLTFSGTNYAISSLYLGDGSSITWPQYSKVLVTGQVLLNGEWIPLGTLLGQISGVATAASISIDNIKDNKNQTSNVYTTLVNSGVSSTDYRNLKISLYQRAAGQTDFCPLGIYMTATGTNGRTFLDIYGGVEALSVNNNYGGFAEPNVRIGNLQGLPNVGGQTPSGWGIYTDNGYFKGIIAADKGYIGSGSRYWVIANYEDGSNPNNSRSYIYSYNGTDNGTDSVTSTVEGIYLGTDGIRNYKDSTHYVTIKNGVISALGVDLTGQITATSGTIGGWNIGTDTNKSLYYGNQTPGATTTNLVLSPTSATNSNAIGGSTTGLNWFLSAGKVFGVTTAGALYATSGKIGGWQIGNTALSVGTWGENNSALICTGSGTEKSIGGSDLINNWVFTAGANFGVTKSGALYASSANISGNITATSGTIGGIDIINGNLNVSSINISSLNGASNYAQKTEVNEAKTAIQNIQTLIRQYSDGVLVCKTNNTVGALVNANGSFDITSLTWTDGVPSPGTSISSFSSSGIRLGSSSSSNYALIDTDSFDIYHDSTNLIHFGYGEGTAEAGTTSNAPYYTLGARNTNHPTVGNYSLVEGRGNEASGYASHSEGWGNAARGSSSHAEGHNCHATGDYSHAEGFGSLAAGRSSHASGEGSYAQSDYQTVIGKCNILDNNGTYAFIIGNGINRAGQQSNAFTVDWSGNVISSGGATIGGNASITGTLDATGAITQNGTAVSLDGHKHAAGDITSGTLPIDKGGTGDTGTSATTTASSIVTAGSGFTIESASYAQWGKVAMIHIVFKKNATAITTATNISLGTLVSGKRPKYRAMGMSGWTQNALVYTDGVIHMYGTVAANASVGIYSTFILA